MVNKCVVNTCNTIKAGDGVSMHRLPADSNTRGHWFKAMSEKIGQTVFREEDEICSKHFNATNFENVDGVAVLRSDAVPFNFCPDEVFMPRAKRSKRDEAVTPECSVFSCTNTLNATNLIRPNLNYYPFPKPKTLLTSWKQFCNKTDEDFTHSFVCSDHFTPSDFTIGANTSAGSLASRVLKTNAVPTIYKTEIKYEDMIDEGETAITPQNAMEMEYSSGDNSVSCISGDKVCGIENCESRAGGRSDVEYYPPNVMKLTSESSDLVREKFVMLLQDRSIVLDRSRERNIHRLKIRAAEELSRKYSRIIGKPITQKQLFKKIDNMKKTVRTKMSKVTKPQRKPLQLKKWEEDFIKLMITKRLSIWSISHCTKSGNSASTSASTLTSTESNEISKFSNQNNTNKATVQLLESQETKNLTDQQLKRLINLEKLKLIRLLLKQNDKKQCDVAIFKV